MCCLPRTALSLPPASPARCEWLLRAMGSATDYVQLSVGVVSFLVSRAFCLCLLLGVCLPNCLHTGVFQGKIEVGVSASSRRRRPLEPNTPAASAVSRTFRVAVGRSLVLLSPRVAVLGSVRAVPGRCAAAGDAMAMLAGGNCRRQDCLYYKVSIISSSAGLAARYYALRENARRDGSNSGREARAGRKAPPPPHRSLFREADFVLCPAAGHAGPVQDTRTAKQIHPFRPRLGRAARARAAPLITETAARRGTCRWNGLEGHGDRRAGGWRTTCPHFGNRG